MDPVMQVRLCRVHVSPVSCALHSCVGGHPAAPGGRALPPADATLPGQPCIEATTAASLEGAQSYTPKSLRLVTTSSDKPWLHKLLLVKPCRRQPE